MHKQIAKNTLLLLLCSVSFPVHTIKKEEEPGIQILFYYVLLLKELFPYFNATSITLNPGNEFRNVYVHTRTESSTIILASGINSKRRRP